MAFNPQQDLPIESLLIKPFGSVGNPVVYYSVIQPQNKDND